MALHVAPFPAQGGRYQPVHLLLHRLVKTRASGKAALQDGVPYARRRTLGGFFILGLALYSGGPYPLDIALRSYSL